MDPFPDVHQIHSPRSNFCCDLIEVFRGIFCDSNEKPHPKINISCSRQKKNYFQFHWYIHTHPDTHIAKWWKEKKRKNAIELDKQKIREKTNTFTIALSHKLRSSF